MPILEPCTCTCGCTEPATTIDDGGNHSCEECADYYTTEDGDVVCSRKQGETECRHCGEAIEWCSIQTNGGPGPGNWREGTCGCEGREWIETEHGGEWRLAEREAESGVER